MENSLLLTQASRYRRMRSVNATGSFPSKVSVHAAPAESRVAAASQAAAGAVWDLAGNAGREDSAVQNLVKLTPYGVGADTNTFKMRVYGWHLLNEQNDETELWIPELLGEFTCTLSSAQPGVANMVLTATDYFCDVISAAGTLSSSNYTIDQPGADQIATITLDMKGAKKLETTFDTNSSATSCNCLAQQY